MHQAKRAFIHLINEIKIEKNAIVVIYIFIIILLFVVQGLLSVALCIRSKIK